MCVVSVHMHMPMSAHGGQKRALCVFPYYSLPYSFEAGSLPVTESSRFLARLAVYHHPLVSVMSSTGAAGLHVLTSFVGARI